MKDDLISRYAAISIIEEKQKDLCPAGRFGRQYIYGIDREKFDAWDEIIDQLAAFPAADVAPVVHGHWIKPSTNTWDHYCSVCKGPKPYFYGYGEINSEFCPHCSAKMDKEEK